MKILGLIKGKDAALVGAGAVIGTLGMKALQSKTARKLCVQGVAAGMRAKDGFEDVLEGAKAQADDIVAEAAYLNAQNEAAAEATAEETEPVAAAPATEPAPASAPAVAAE